MVRTLEQAIAQISQQSDADHGKIGRKLLWHVEKLDALRGEIDKGVSSLDAGKGRTLSIEEFLSHKNFRSGGA
jgi:hypothetical protein